MSRFIIRPNQLAGRLRAEAHKVSRVTIKASVAAARRLVTHIKEKTEAAGVTDTGIYKNSWVVEKTPLGATAINDAPHAGVIELGARPHPVSQEGREAIKLWAMRKLGLNDAEAASAAWGIAKKLKREGQKGHFIVRDSMGAARRFYAEEFLRIIKSERA